MFDNRGLDGGHSFSAIRFGVTVINFADLRRFRLVVIFRH
jgi:hypothetical protein